jgi:hypothetical protein
VTPTTLIHRPEDLPADAVSIRPDGLLSRVARDCPEHGGESPCVGRKDDSGCLVFWCARGLHHFTAR